MLRLKNVAAAAALPLLAVLAACSSDEAPVAAPATPASVEATGPVSIEHRYGTTVVETAPARVVSVGYTDQDPVLALGVVPVGIRDWYGDQPDATWPWAHDLLGSTKPTVLKADAIDPEAVAALRPDLIVGINSGMTEKEYATLSKIAPTLAAPEEFVDFGTPWDETQRIVGRALFKEDEAEQVVADVRDRIEQAKSANPSFAGAEAVFGSVSQGVVYAYGPQDSRARILEELGMATPAGISDLAGEAFYATISKERLDLVDADALILLATDPAELETLRSSAVYEGLGVAKEGRDIELSDPVLGGAASFGSALSIPLVLDELVPQLAAALDGDPATTA